MTGTSLPARIRFFLNAPAVASLEDELVSVQADVATLLKAMEASIAEPNDFIQTMSQE